MFVDSEEIEKYIDYRELVDALRDGFRSEIIVPKRHHYGYQSTNGAKESSLLLMPAWQNNNRVGVKIVTVSPENGKLKLPSINGSYILMDAKTGKTLMQMDARFLTVARTACASALASSYLSRTNCSSMLMIGCGALAPHLIKAHCAIRPITKVYVWARDSAKASTFCSSLDLPNVEVCVVNTIDEVINKVDIVSSATLSEKPLVLGESVVEGQHIDLVGAYTPSMREGDDELIQKAKVYVDSMQGMLESGDIALAIQSKIIKEKDIQGDLFMLCRSEVKGRESDLDISVFKSVGHALEDLVAANYFYTILKKQE